MSIFLILYLLGIKSNSAPATCNSSPTKQHIGLTSKPYNLNLSHDVFLVVNQGTSKDYTNVHLPNVTEKEDNINDKESKNIDQSESVRETDSKLV